jgi:hypothetical protein
MIKRFLASTAIAVAAASAVLVTGATPASAVSTANTVSASSVASGGTVTGTCAFLVSLPQTGSIDTIPVAFTGTATSAGVAVSTSIRCYLTNGGSGGNGITLPGPEAVIAGTGSYYRLAPSPQICATVSAAFSNGSTAPSKTSCHAL